MNARVVAAVALALLLGAGAGYAVAATGDDADAAPAATTTTPEPVQASDPSLPVPVVSPDPDDPPLATALELRTVELVRPTAPDSGEAVVLDVPADWVQSPPDLVSDKYAFDPDGEDKDFTYVLYVQFTDDATPESGARRRISELRSAQAQGNTAELDVRPDLGGAGFDADYLGENDYRRVSLERWFASPDGETVVWIRAVGRDRDRQGLEDLVSRATIPIQVQSP